MKALPIKKTMAAIVAAIMLFSLLPVSVFAEGGSKTTSPLSIPDGYNEHDYNACVAFLEQADASGIRNGEKINEDYDPNDPETWYGRDTTYWNNESYFVWNDDAEKRLTAIHLYGNELCGMLDLSNCSMLRTVYCYGYGGTISEIDLTGCTSVRNIELSNMIIAELDVSDCTELYSLTATNGNLSSLDTSANTSLRYLDCRGNRLVGLNVYNNTELINIDCSSNSISNLDLSNNTNLVELNCYGNNLSSLNLCSNTALETLYCGGNNIHELDLSGCSELTSLNCSGCALDSLDVSDCLVLESISCSNNNLTCLDLSNHESLTSVYCANNEITELNVTGCQSLSSVNCRYNKLTALNFSTNPELYVDYVYVEGAGTIACEYGDLYAVSNGSALFSGWYNEAGDLLSESDEIWPENYDTTTFIARFTTLDHGEYNEHDFSALVSFLEQGNYWSKNGERLSENYDPTDPTTWGESFTWEPVDGEYRITVIDINHDSGSWSSDESVEGNLDVSGCTELVSLRCTRQQLQRLNASGCISLVSLDCSDNENYSNDTQLDYLSVEGCSSLESLQCNWNDIAFMDLSDCPALRKLNCSGNLLTDLDLSSNNLIEEVNCANNSIGELDLSSNPSITYLDCSGCSLELLDVTGCSELTELRCGNNSIRFLNVLNCGGLELLDCSNNKIAELNLSNAPLLWAIYCNGNLLTELDLSATSHIMQNLIIAEEGGTIGFERGWWTPCVYAHASKGYAFIGWFDEFDDLLSNEECFYLEEDFYETPVLIARFVKVEYNENDFNKVAAFLNRTDSDGVKIGAKFNPDFDETNPSTWTGVKWVAANGEQRVWTIDWSYPDTDIVSGGRLDLSDCEKLESLECSELHISNLNVNNDTSLRRIYCSYNYLTSIDVSSCNLLETLSCSNNYLTTINVRNCTELRGLFFGGDNESNRITAIDLSDNNKLKYLECSYNELSSLDISNCHELLSLSCQGNNLSVLDVSCNPDLTDLSCGGSGLSTIDLSNNPELEELELWYSRVDEIDLSHNPKLKRLIVSQTNIGALDLSANEQLEYCDVDWNYHLKSIQLHDKNMIAEGIGYLEYSINYNGSYLYADCISGSNFYGWFDGNGTIIAEPGEDPYSSHSINVNETDSDTIIAHFTSQFNAHDVSKLRGFFELEDENGVTNIEKLDRSGYESIEYDPNDPSTWLCSYEYGQSYYISWTDVDGELRVSYIAFGETGSSYYSPELAGPFDVSGCTALEYLYLGGNEIGTIVFEGCHGLKSLDLSENNLASLDLSDCPALEYLECGSNKLTELDVSCCPLLTHIDCGYNKLTELDLSANTELQELYCYRNDLSMIDVSANSKLYSLACSYNKLTMIDLSNNSELCYFYCEGNNITELDFSCNPEIGMERISAEGNGSIGFSSNWGSECYAYDRKNGFFMGWYDLDGALISAERNYYADDDEHTILMARFEEFDYNENDWNAVLSFLEQENSEGEKLGILLAEKASYTSGVYCDYDSDDPTTWPGVTWDLIDNELRLKSVYWSNLSSWSSTGSYSTYFSAPLSTVLNLSGCAGLTSVYCSGLNLTSVDLSGCDAVESVTFEWNKLSRIDLTSCANLKLDSVVADGNGTVGCYARSSYLTLYSYPNEGEEFLGWFNEAAELLSNQRTLYASNLDETCFRAVFSGYVPLPEGVTVTCTEGGEIQYSYETEDDSLTVSWEADEGYTCTAIKVNGVVIATRPSSPYVIENLSQYSTRSGNEIVIEVVFGPDAIMGDLNNDGEVNASDAILIMRYALGIIDLDEVQLLAADVNGDGAVNASDAIIVMRKALGIVA